MTISSFKKIDWVIFFTKKEIGLEGPISILLRCNIYIYKDIFIQVSLRCKIIPIEKEQIEESLLLVPMQQHQLLLHDLELRQVR